MRYILFDNMEDCSAHSVEQLSFCVPSSRREEAMRFKHLFGQFACLKAYSLWNELRNSSDLSLPDWQKTELGKPYVDGEQEFSVSHCQNAIAVAVDDFPIGIDVESVRKDNAMLVERTMNREEQSRINAAALPMLEFAALWTKKEALLKQQGSGILSMDALPNLLSSVPQNIRIDTIINEEKQYACSIAYRWG